MVITFAVTAVSSLHGGQMIENEEVLAKIDEYRLQVSLSDDTYLRIMGISVLDACEAAVKKQIPQKPNIYVFPSGIIKAMCPHCLMVEDESANYCRACGQALDWEDMNES